MNRTDATFGWNVAFDKCVTKRTRIVWLCCFRFVGKFAQSVKKEFAFFGFCRNLRFFCENPNKIQPEWPRSTWPSFRTCAGCAWSRNRSSWCCGWTGQPAGEVAAVETVWKSSWTKLPFAFRRFVELHFAENVLVHDPRRRTLDTWIAHLEMRKVVLWAFHFALKKLDFDLV